MYYNFRAFFEYLRLFFFAAFPFSSVHILMFFLSVLVFLLIVVDLSPVFSVNCYYYNDSYVTSRKFVVAALADVLSGKSD